MKMNKLALLAAATFMSTSFAVSTSFSPEQREEIGKIASDYIVQHPEVLMKASANLQKKQMEAMQKKMISKVLENKDKLLNDPDTPANNPEGAKVAVVEFFDYNCAFCHKVFPAIEKAMKDNPNVKFVFKEFPIFAARWSSSKYGAEVGHAVYKLKGFSSYIKYHDAVFNSGKMEGKLTDADIDAALKDSGADLSKVKALAAKEANYVKDTLTFGSKLGFQFTPVFVILPIDGATAQNTTVIPGYTTAEVLQKAIDKAAGDKAPASDDKESATENKAAPVADQ